MKIEAIKEVLKSPKLIKEGHNNILFNGIPPMQDCRLIAETLWRWVKKTILSLHAENEYLRKALLESNAVLEGALMSDEFTSPDPNRIKISMEKRMKKNTILLTNKD